MSAIEYYVAVDRYIQTFTTYSKFSGTDPPPQDKFVQEVGRLDLASALAFLGSISINLVQLENRGLSPSSLEFQCPYLLHALVDDYPAPLIPQLRKGREGLLLPGAEGCQLIHQHGLAYLSHMLLLHADGERIINFPKEAEQRRILRLMLIGNDYLGAAATARSAGAKDLMERRRSIGLDFIRLSQFSRSDYFYPVMEDFARQYLLFTKYLPAHFPDILSRFEKATGGISIQGYFRALLMFVAYFFTDASSQSPVWTREGLLQEIEGGRDLLEALITNQWVRTPSEYRVAHDKWKNDRPPGDASFDLVTLRERPLVELEDGHLVCPHLPFLFEKVRNEPYYLIDDTLSKSDKGRFGRAMGLAYEDYANSLIKRIAIADKGGPWYPVGQVTSSKGAEYQWEIDFYIQRGDVAIALEHKAIRLSPKFLRGGEDGMVLGPVPSESLRVGVGGGTAELAKVAEFAKTDDGLLTRGLWRFSVAQSELRKRVTEASGLQPAREVFAIQTRSANLVLPGVIAEGYLGLLISEAGLLSESYWCKPPQWVDVNVLEALARIAEKGQLDLEEFLRAKVATSPYGRFDEAVYALANQIGLPPHDPQLAVVWKGLLDGAASSFFPESQALEGGSSSSTHAEA